MTSSLAHSTPCPPRAFLLNGGTLADLTSRYGIEVRRHGTIPNLVQLKYNQIKSPMHEPIVQECRGLILDEDDSWTIVAWPFRKFFNHGEALADPIDWATATVQEKIDGSLMILYWYDGNWHVATSGMPDAGGAIGNTAKPFMQLFWETWHRKQFVLPVYHGFTWMFELTSPLNRIVVPHQEHDLSLIGMRSIWSGNEVSARFRSAYNPVKSFPLQSMDDVVATFKEMDPLQQEGYVIVDSAFHRIKVKHPGYVALHHLKSSFSIKRVVEVVRSGEGAEVLHHFPEWKKSFEIVQAAYDGLVTSLEQDYAELEGLKSNRKNFALAAKLGPYPAVHFHLLDGHAASVRDALKTVQIDRMVEMLGVKGAVLEGAI